MSKYFRISALLSATVSLVATATISARDLKKQSNDNNGEPKQAILANSDTSATSRGNSTTDGRPKGLTVSFTPDEPVSISFSCPGKNILESGTLIKIDDRPIAKLTALQIERLLCGAVGSKVKLGYLNSVNTYIETTLVRSSKMAALKEHPPYGVFYKLLNQDEDQLAMQFNAGRTPPDYALYYNCDLSVRADIKHTLEDAMLQPWKTDDYITNAAAKGVYYSLAIGDLQLADQYLNTLLTHQGTGEAFWQYFSNCRKPFITLLIDSGKLNAAQKLLDIAMQNCEQQSKSKDIQSSASITMSPMRRSLLKLKAKLFAKQNNPDLSSVVDQLYQDLEKQQEFDQEYASLIAGYLEKLQQYDKATNCYRRIIKEQECCLESGDENYHYLNAYCRDSYNYARLLALAGKKVDAVKSLSKAIDYYDLHTKETERIDLERCSGLFPKPSDLELKLAELHIENGNGTEAVKHASIAVKLLERALGKDCEELGSANQILSKAQRLSGDRSRATALENQTQFKRSKLAIPKDSSDFELINQTTEFLKSGQQSQSRQTIDQLLKAYEQRGNSREGFIYTKANLNCALTQLARFSSDIGDFDTSNYILNQLKAIVPLIESEQDCALWLELETLINQSRQNAVVDWPSLDKSAILAPLAPAERSRLIALIFYRAGDRARAKLFLEHAMECAGSKTLERALVLLDHASFNVGSQKFDEASTEANEALNLVKTLSPYTDPEDYIKFANTYRLRIANYGNQLARAKRYDLCERFLQSALSELNQGAASAQPTSNSSVIGAQINLSSIKDTIIVESLGQCLLQAGKSADAIALLQQAQQSYGDYGQPPALDIATIQCALALDKRENLPKMYRRIAEKLNSYGGTEYQAISDYYLKAAVAAESTNTDIPATNLTLEQLQKVFLEKLGTRSNTIDLFSLMLPTMPDNTQTQKLQSDINAYAMDVSKMSKDEQVTEKLILMIRIAKLSEQCNAAAAARSWLSIAEFEIQIGKYQECYEHVANAISQLNKQEPICTSSFQIKGLVKSLIAHGYQGDMEPLLTGCSQKYEELYGRSSLNFLGTLSALASFYSDKNLSQKAHETVDQLLAVSIRKQENSFWFNDDTPIGLLIKDLAPSERLASDNNISADEQSNNKSTNHVESQTEKSKIKIDETYPLRLELLSQILKAQKEQLGPDDLRVAITLAAIGKLQSKLNAKESALDSCREALRINKLYDPDSNEVRALQLAIANIQNKTSPKDETWKEYVDRSTKGFPFDGTDTSEFYLSTDSDEQKLQKLQVQYKGASKLAPYSLRSSCLLAAMIPLAQSLDKNTLLANLLKDQLAIYEHRPLSTLPREQRTAQSLKRLQRYASLVDTLTKLGHAEEAKTEALNASEILLSDIAKRELDILIKMNKTAGNDELATQYTRQLQALPERKL